MGMDEDYSDGNGNEGSARGGLVAAESGNDGGTELWFPMVAALRRATAAAAKSWGGRSGQAGYTRMTRRRSRLRCRSTWAHGAAWPSGSAEWPAPLAPICKTNWLGLGHNSADRILGQANPPLRLRILQYSRAAEPSPRLAPDTAAARPRPPSRVRSSAPTTHLPARPGTERPRPRLGPTGPHPSNPSRPAAAGTSCPDLTAGTRTARRPPSPHALQNLSREHGTGLADHLRTAPHWVLDPGRAACR
ncbi:hypothetical protein PVAP13_9NG251773 [Panicum virgatum]|uniref:Uncharacterized protein n=1 Tax=Panicum virgatum TaxID=38727 RepID=A0A8T0MPB3_PANVG|nr:hypothetical protein PVAP13_9NG251773 [Panicum virgatum]